MLMQQLSKHPEFLLDSGFFYLSFLKKRVIKWIFVKSQFWVLPYLSV